MEWNQQRNHQMKQRRSQGGNGKVATLEQTGPPGLVLLLGASFILLSFPLAVPSRASSGTEGGAFLEIPVGAGPAAMGGAYSALANDAYAPTLNPGGLGFLDSTQLAGQHLAYLESIHYEYLSFGVPLPRSMMCDDKASCLPQALGGSVQYLGSGDIAGTDGSGHADGTYTSYYAAYNLSYGRLLTDRLSLGVTGKWINAKIADTSANAFAADIGSMYHATNQVTLAGVLTNMGTKLNFLNQGDSLPLEFHLGAAYEPTRQWKMSVEGVYAQTGLTSGRLGLEWHPIPMMTLRTGYRTDTVNQLGAIAGFTTGLGLLYHGIEFSYAWLPAGDLGNSNYFSLTVRLGEAANEKRNLVHYQTIKQNRTAAAQIPDPEYQQLMQLLSADENPQTAQRPKPAAPMESGNE